MYKEHLICVVVPAYNEETQIGKVIKTIPDFIDRIVIIDDYSSDKTCEVVSKYAETNNKIHLIKHTRNMGVGEAIASGYKFARDKDYDIAVVMAGDAQMDPDELPLIIDPVADGSVDYTKGNRLFTGEAYKKIPKLRYFGNSILSLLTKIASGYWHVADSQSGYTAINKKALKVINWDKMYKKYGQPNDLLVKLNIYKFKVRDVPIKPLYNVGEKSGIKIRVVIFSISWLLLKLFLWRLKEKYIIRDFHPLVFFYSIGFLFFILSFLFSIRLCYFWILLGFIPKTTALFLFFSFMSFSQFTLFAMWFDMEANKNLK